jgi:hypothetical protein
VNRIDLQAGEGPQDGRLKGAWRLLPKSLYANWGRVGLGAEVAGAQGERPGGRSTISGG